VEGGERWWDTIVMCCIWLWTLRLRVVKMDDEADGVRQVANREERDDG